MPDKNLPTGAIERLIEVDRLAKEGASLKNVAENMRTIVVMVAMFIAIGAMLTSPHWPVRALAVVWGVWTIVYSSMATLQAGFLLVLALYELPSMRRFINSSTMTKRVVAYSFAVVTVVFMVSAFLVLATSFEVLANRGY